MQIHLSYLPHALQVLLRIKNPKNAGQTSHCRPVIYLSVFDMQYLFSAISVKKKSQCWSKQKTSMQACKQTNHTDSTPDRFLFL